MVVRSNKSSKASPHRLDGRRGFLKLGLLAFAEHKRPRTTAQAPSVRNGRPFLSTLRMCAFEPRVFPPPDLAGVPIAYILHQLQCLAPHYWSQPETADCTLIIPSSDFSRSDVSPFDQPSTFADGTAGFARRTYDPMGSARRSSEPATPVAPPMVMKLHVDYLSAHSSLLRGLFAGASPADLINATALPPTFSSKILPRVLPSSEAKHPKLYLPVPDPESFPLIVHWCYFRDFAFLERKLDAGEVRWDALARNAEYLGLAPDFKVCLGRYYARAASACPRAPQNSPWSSEEELPEDSSDEAESSEEDTESDSFDEESDDRLPRGRTTSIRNIGSHHHSLLHARASFADGMR